jgi:uncharacterized protein YlzI (FlbEa/FlbD family)
MSSVRKLPHALLELANGAAAISKNPSHHVMNKLPRHYTAIIAVSVIVIPALLFRDDIEWTWMNRFVYVGCPEYSFVFIGLT